MRDHGAEQLVLDFSSDDVESKLDSIIRETRNILKESIPEGGSTYRKSKQNKVTFSVSFVEMEMFLHSVMSLILLVPEDKLDRPALNFSEAIVNATLPDKYGPTKLRV